MYNYIKNMRELRKIKAYIEKYKTTIDPDNEIGEQFPENSDGVIKSIMHSCESGDDFNTHSIVFSDILKPSPEKEKDIPIEEKKNDEHKN